MPEARPLQPGDPAQIGDYEITGKLGSGGLGVVYLGMSPAGGTVAVRVMQLRSLENPNTRVRFLEELHMARRITTSCTAQVIDAGVVGDMPYIVSEYVRGPSLQELVTAEGPRGRRALERLAIGTATALAALHRVGIVHQDVRPANVLLASDGPRLIDVGIARALESAHAMTILTPGQAYLSPEQVSGGDVSPAVDVFAWASTVFYAATGEPPFGQGAGPQIMGRIIYDDPDLSRLPDTLRDVVADAFAKEVSQRPLARELVERLLGKESPTSGMSDRKIAEARTLAAEDDPRGLPGGPPSDHQIRPIPAGNATFVDRFDTASAPAIGGDLPGGGAGAPISASFAESGYVPLPARPGEPPTGPSGPSQQPHGGGFGEQRALPAPGEGGPLDPAMLADPEGLTGPVRSYEGGVSRLPALPPSYDSPPSYNTPASYDSPRPYDSPSSYDSPASYDFPRSFGGSAADVTPSYGSARPYEVPSMFDQLQSYDSGSASASGTGQRPFSDGDDRTVGLDSLMGSGRSVGDRGDDPAFNATAIQSVPDAWRQDAPPGSRNDRDRGFSRRSTPPSLTFGPRNRLLGVAAAIGVGLVAGILLIALVIRPQDDDGDDKAAPVATSSALDNTPVQSIPVGFKGTWRGTAVNQDGNSFEVTAVFREGQTTATVLYTPMNCAGLLSFTKGTRLRLEMALSTRKPCTSGDVVLAKQADGSLIYSWRHPGSRHQYRATLATR